MTALADVLFQLLIFFMLSSNLIPFSMLSLRSGGLEGGATNAPQTETGGEGGHNTSIGTTAVWTLRPGAVVAGGQVFDASRLPGLVDALKMQGTPNVLLILKPEVKVQHLTTVLEALSDAGITSVQIARGGA